MFESAPRLTRRFSWFLFGSISFGVAMFLAGLSHAAGKPPPGPPINSEIVYEIATANGVNLAVANADGTNQKVVLSNRGNNSSPSWSPDGTQIIFASNLPSPGIYRLGIKRNTGQADGTPQLITHLNNAYLPLANPVWSPVATPDGQSYIAYSDTSPGVSDYSIYLVDPATLNSFKLTNPPPGVSDLRHSWSPDATQIAVSHRSDNNEPTPYDIQVLTLGTTGCPVGQSLCEVQPRQSLVENIVGSPLLVADPILAPAWGNNGNEIAVFALIPPNDNGDIWIIPVANPEDAWNLTDTNKANPPDRQETAPTWSPNDSQIMYRALRGLCNNRDKNFQGIVVRNLNGIPFPDGCEEKILINDANSPSWWRGLPQP
jgi:Tol biopolymer transport system component